MDIHTILYCLGKQEAEKTEIAANIVEILLAEKMKTSVSDRHGPDKVFVRARFFLSTEKRQGTYGRKPGVVGFPWCLWGSQRPVKGRRGPVCVDAGGERGSQPDGTVCRTAGRKTTRYYYVINPANIFRHSGEIRESLDAIMVFSPCPGRTAGSNRQSYMGGYTTAELIAGYYGDWNRSLPNWI